MLQLVESYDSVDMPRQTKIFVVQKKYLMVKLSISSQKGEVDSEVKTEGLAQNEEEEEEEKGLLLQH
jgi:hypothetical protein